MSVSQTLNSESWVAMCELLRDSRDSCHPRDSWVRKSAAKKPLERLSATLFALPGSLGLSLRNALSEDLFSAHGFTVQWS